MTSVDWQRRSRREQLLLRDELLARLSRRERDRREPYPWQRLHEHGPGFTGLCGPECADLPTPTMRAHDMWLQMGGRGTGKTDGGAIYVLDHVNGPACIPTVKGGHRVAIVAPTLGDAAASCVTGPSGLQHYERRVRMSSVAGGTIVRFPNGATARLFGGHTRDDVNRLRSGGNTCLVWLEEVAAIRYLEEVLANASMGLRQGPNPHFVASTTPRVRREVKELMEAPTTHVTRGRTRDAHALNPDVRDALERKFAGTTAGRQELDGELLSDVEGAPWTRWLIDQHRVRPQDVPTLGQAWVGLDPNAGGKDEAGIVVLGVAAHPAPNANGHLVHHVYVLEDRSFHARLPGEWARAAVAAVHRWGANGIVAEVNQGWNMVPAIVGGEDPTVHVVSVHAADGKLARSGPVVGLSEQGSLHIVGSLPTLEDQMCTWVDSESWSPDRMDALVWAATHAALPRQRGGRASAA